MRSNEESRLVSQIIKHIYDNYTRMVYRVNTGSVLMRNGRRFSTGTPAGHPDIYCVLPGGKICYIEAKAPHGKPTDKQTAFLQQAREQGAGGGIAYSLADVDEIITKMTPKVKE